MIDREQAIINRVGKNLKRFRNSKKWSIRKLALEADMAPSTIDRIERGQRNPSVTILAVLAEALQVDPGEFFRKKLG